MQIKMTLTYQSLTPVRMAKIKNTNELRLERMWSMGTLLHAGGNANMYNHFGNQYGSYSENWETT